MHRYRYYFDKKNSMTRTKNLFSMLVTSVLFFLSSIFVVQAQQPIQGMQQPIYLMGEVHDNLAIHEARLARLKQDIKAGWRPAIIMEQFDRERQDDLTSAWQTCPDAACVIKKAGHEGWNWSF